MVRVEKTFLIDFDRVAVSSSSRVVVLAWQEREWILTFEQPWTSWWRHLRTSESLAWKKKGQNGRKMQTCRFACLCLRVCCYNYFPKSPTNHLLDPSNAKVAPFILVPHDDLRVLSLYHPSPLWPPVPLADGAWCSKCQVFSVVLWDVFSICQLFLGNGIGIKALSNYFAYCQLATLKNERSRVKSKVLWVGDRCIACLPLQVWRRGTSDRSDLLDPIGLCVW